MSPQVTSIEQKTCALWRKHAAVHTAHVNVHNSSSHVLTTNDPAISNSSDASHDWCKYNLSIWCSHSIFHLHAMQHFCIRSHELDTVDSPLSECIAIQSQFIPSFSVISIEQMNAIRLHCECVAAAPAAEGNMPLAHDSFLLTVQLKLPLAAPFQIYFENINSIAIDGWLPDWSDGWISFTAKPGATARKWIEIGRWLFQFHLAFIKNHKNRQKHRNGMKL